MCSYRSGSRLAFLQGSGEQKAGRGGIKMFFLRRVLSRKTLCKTCIIPPVIALVSSLHII